VPNLDELKGKIVLIFFWAHWCTECRAERPSVAKLTDKYRSQGLVLIAPTERYGHVEGSRPAPPDRELRYIIQIRDTHYGFLRDVPVPVAERTSARFERSRL
jgi:thiol-disulfide isomerase/thioredoxin